MVVGNNPQAESFILTSRARTMDDFFVAIREWEEFALDREPLESEYPLSKPVAIPVEARSGQGHLSPTAEKVNSLIETIAKLQSQWTDVGTRFSRPATPVDPRTFSGFQHLTNNQRSANRPTISLHIIFRGFSAHFRSCCG